MKLNADFSKRVVIRPDDYDWVDSPASGVQRMMLDRIGEEVARATTIVRFAPNSQFDPHTHGGGEEFLVLEGVFSDEHGDYPAGSYVRNPIGTSHRPHIGPEGCTILVKLCQFSETDTDQKAIDTRKAAFLPGSRPGLTVLPLHSHEAENVALVRWAPGTRFADHAHWGGEEIFVIEGTFQDEHGDYPAGTWIRSPHLSRHNPWSDEGCLIYVKTGHLPDMAA
ncbi:cupin domain-containing protein [Nioella sediminis]|jgi:anti-sigma factor ChrR (cupin superfamily)|uniref:cupin domain-containing protein n=1 Tax=Nioella sediminis TaxID=1912092 RepID=UPI0008FD460E|nr:cupin domain-containing protein [Nioella sediminis]TBX18677.1 cupin [Roseovarius sp. JS7-11]